MTQTGSQWWRSAVIYQIYPKSFADDDGDGLGDIAGIRSRLGYLANLGVDAIWISPWYLSPQVDGGYDVTDFRVIDPIFGDLAAVERLVGDAHALGIRVIVDIVPNHTSDEHRFFQEALASPPGSAAWARYHCLPGASGGALPPNDWRSVFGGSAWEPIRDGGGVPTGWYYLHLFDPRQPDVNWEHPDIWAEYEDVLRFWFDRGVDGCRIDVAQGLVKASGYPDSGQREIGLLAGPPLDEPQWDQPGVHEVWRRWRAVADEYQPPRAFVGEVWVGSPERLAQYLRPDELHTAFNFDFLRCPWQAEAMRDTIDGSLRAVGAVGAASTWVLENHDVPRVRTRFGQRPAGTAATDSSMSAPPGVVPDDDVGLARARAAMLLMLGLPGSAYLYQGQELGLPEVLDIAPADRQDPAFARTHGRDGYRDGCRVPIPWSRCGPSAGFNADDGAWLPIPGGWGSLSVEAQADDEGSTLRLTRSALALRRTEPALGEGDLEWVSDPGADCLVLRRGEGADAVLVAVNMGRRPADVPAGHLLLASHPSVRPVRGGLRLPPDTAAWMR